MSAQSLCGTSINVGLELVLNHDQHNVTGLLCASEILEQLEQLKNYVQYTCYDLQYTLQYFYYTH